jgi:hypothetical protein
MDHGHDTVELIAAIVLVVGGGIVTARMFLTRPARHGAVAPAIQGSGLGAAHAELPTLRRSFALILAGLSAGAALIHFAAAPSHYVELGDLGAGFIVAAAFQAAWTRWCLAGPSRRTAIVGIAANLAIVGAWTYTRVFGLPVGPFAGGPEPVGFPDAASVVFELLLVIGLLAGLVGIDVGVGRRRALRELASIAVVPVVGLVIVLTSLATVAIAAGLDHGVGGQHGAVHVAAP